MKCPIDTTVDLVMTDRSGIEIDYCPTCRGVWLDRGELDKIIERNVPAPAAVAGIVAAAPAAPAAVAAPAPSPAPQKRWDDDWDDDRRTGDPDRYDSDKKYKKKKRSSFLEEIFDF